MSFNYSTYKDAERFREALIHFGNVVYCPMSAKDDEYFDADANDALASLREFPVITCSKSRKRPPAKLPTITIRWTMGEMQVTMFPLAAEAAMKWAEDKRINYFIPKV